jgi:hypothetical protein
MLPMAALMLASSSCVDRFETPSEYGEVAYLCGDGADADVFDPELEARIDACRDAGPDECPGVMNLVGVLEDTDIALLLEPEEIEIEEDDDGIFGGLGIVGIGPYVAFELTFAHVGGALAAVLDTSERTRTLVNNNDDPDDDLAYMEMRLSSGGAVTIRSQSGDVVFTRIAETEVRGRFTASLYRFGVGAEVEDDVVEGCFHIFAE